jgi:hypothetical protein
MVTTSAAIALPGRASGHRRLSMGFEAFTGRWGWGLCRRRLAPAVNGGFRRLYGNVNTVESAHTGATVYMPPQEGLGEGFGCIFFASLSRESA